MLLTALNDQYFLKHLFNAKIVLHTRNQVNPWIMEDMFSIAVQKLGSKGSFIVGKFKLNLDYFLVTILVYFIVTFTCWSMTKFAHASANFTNWKINPGISINADITMKLSSLTWSDILSNHRKLICLLSLCHS